MTSPWIGVLAAVFLWWFSTGAILMVVKRADRAGGDAHLSSVIWGLPFLVFGMVGFVGSLGLATLAGVFIGFVSALAIWGWIELAFLAGIVTGPNRAPCPARAEGTDRFLAACATIAYHEGALVSALLAMIWTAYGADNQIAVWTFAVLFAARISAKLNLFFGVPRINTEFLPTPLAHIPSYFRQGPVNAGFPFSVTFLSFATAIWLQGLLTADSAPAVMGFALLTALSALALLEHWLMVLPLPDAKLWRWMLPAPKPDSN